MLVRDPRDCMRPRFDPRTWMSHEDRHCVRRGSRPCRQAQPVSWWFCARGVGAACSAAFRPGNVGPETGWGSAMDAAGCPRSDAGHAAGRVSSPGSPRARTVRPIRARPDDPRRFPRATATGHPATGPARLLPIETTSGAVGSGPRSLARCSSWTPVWHRGWDKYGPGVRKDSPVSEPPPAKVRRGPGAVGSDAGLPDRQGVGHPTLPGALPGHGSSILPGLTSGPVRDSLWADHS